MPSTTTWSTDAQVYGASALAKPALDALNKALAAAGASTTTIDALRVEAQAEVLADLQRAGDAWSVTSPTGSVSATGAPYPIHGSAPAPFLNNFCIADVVRFRATTDVEAVLGTVDLRRLEIARLLVTLFRAVAQGLAGAKVDVYEQARAAWQAEYQRLLDTLLPTGGLYPVG